MRHVKSGAMGTLVEDIMISELHNHSGPEVDSTECEEWLSFFGTKAVEGVR